MRTSARDVFAVAAAAYDKGNPLLLVERDETPGLLPVLGGQDVLDLGCGRGHYARLARTLGARHVVALDLSRPMLAGAPLPAVVGDGGRLPLAAGVFDVVVAALLLSYLTDCAVALCEMARVLRPGGVLVLSDLHPVASERGWRRSFEGEGRRVVVDAPPATIAELKSGLARAGLSLQALKEVPIDGRLEPEFRRAGRRDFEALAGTPLLVVLRARKEA